MSMRPRGWSFPADCQPRLRGVTTTAARRPDRVAAHAVHWVEHTRHSRAWVLVASECERRGCWRAARAHHSACWVGIGQTRDQRLETEGEDGWVPIWRWRLTAHRVARDDWGVWSRFVATRKGVGKGVRERRRKQLPSYWPAGPRGPSLRWVCRTCNASRCRARCVSSLAVPPFCLPSLCVRQGTAPPRHGGVPTRPLRATLFLFACILFFRSLCVLVPSPSVVSLPQKRRSPIRTGSGDLGLTATARGRARGGT